VGGILRAEHVERNEQGELIRSGRDVSTNSNATNYYTVAEHIRCFLYAWRQPVNSRSIMIREHLVLVARHSMLLRDENARYLDISDYSMDTFVKQPGGTQKVVAPVFSMRIGKTNTSGNVQLGTAVRHADVRRCSVGALPFTCLSDSRYISLYRNYTKDIPFIPFSLLTNLFLSRLMVSHGLIWTTPNGPQ
jgi:hypothetical protein